jgi:MFS family permease
VKPWSRSALAWIASGWWPTSWNLQWLTAAVAVLGALLYLVLRVVASQFYTPLGLTVDDVGLGQLTMLVRTAFGVLLIAVISGAVLLFLILGIAYMFANTRFFLGIAVTGGIFAAMVYFGFLLGARGEELLFVGVTVCASAVGWLLGVMLGGVLQVYLRASFPLAALILLVLFGYGFFVLADVARDDARAVLSGHASVTDAAGIPLLPYRAHIARVAVGNSTSAANKRCVVFLGQDGRSVVVYDAVAKRARLLPADRAVAIDPAARTCPRSQPTPPRRCPARRGRLGAGAAAQRRHRRPCVPPA